MRIKNFGQYYFPEKKLIENLEKLIIFTENTSKGNIPNGSVFVYNDPTHYDPSILKTDVGCGITCFIVDKLNFDEKSIQEISRAVDEVGIHIGQGNHFLDFTTEHPKLSGKNASNMIYLHSDFNNQNILPVNYSHAKDLENIASDKRLEYLKQLTKLLGVSGELYHDWVHNSINRENEKTIYRKGAIDLKKTKGVGVLALNPVDGLLLYTGNFKDYENSVQHGLGRIGSKNELWNKFKKINRGIARTYITSKNDLEIDEIKNRVYNKIDSFINHFYLDFSQMGICKNELVITTKNSCNR